MNINTHETAIRFSIVIPAYNASQFINRTLDSLANQTYTHYEIVITNDGSTDNTEEIIRQFIVSHKTLPIHLVSQKNKGIASARNNGIFRAQGNYIAFLDADDCWYQNKLEKVIETIRNNPQVDVIYHDEMEIRNSGEKRQSQYGKVKDPAYDELLFNGNKLSTSATVIKRELVQKLGGFSENMDFNSAEDYDFWLRLAKHGAIFFYLPIVLGEYHRVTDSVSMKIVYHGNNSFKVIEHHINEMMTNGEYPKHYLQKKLNKLRSKNFLGMGRAFYRNKDYRKAHQYYLKSLNHRPFWWKPYAGLIQNIIYQLI